MTPSDTVRAELVKALEGELSDAEGSEWVLVRAGNLEAAIAALAAPVAGEEEVLSALVSIDGYTQNHMGSCSISTGGMKCTCWEDRLRVIAARVKSIQSALSRRAQVAPVQDTRPDCSAFPITVTRKPAPATVIDDAAVERALEAFMDAKNSANMEYQQKAMRAALTAAFPTTPQPDSAATQKDER